MVPTTTTMVPPTTTTTTTMTATRTYLSPQTALNEQKKLQVQEQRIRENLHKSLVGKFMSAVETYKNAQTRYQTELTGKVKRQVMIVVPDANDEFVNNVMAQVRYRQQQQQQQQQ